MATRVPGAPKTGELLVSRPYGAGEDDALDLPGGTPVTGEGYIVGFAFEANAGEVMRIYDEDGGSDLVFEAIFGVANPAFTALPRDQWIPYRAGARITTGVGATARIRFRPGPIESGPINP